MCSYLSLQLLQKDKNKRLGVKNDFTDVKSHPFFGSINWTNLEAKKVRPPYNPNVVSTGSLKDKYPNFEVGLKCMLMVNPYLLVCSYIR